MGQTQSPDNEASAVQRSWGQDSSAYAITSKLFTHPSANEIVDLVDKLLPLDGQEVYVLDDGTGTGAVSIAMSKRYPNVPILATDLSASMLEKVEGLKLPNVKTLQVDALNLTPALEHNDAVSRTQGFSHIISTFMHQFTAEPFKAVSEMVRAARPNGVVATGTWGEIFDPVTLINEAFVLLDSAQKPMSCFQNDSFPKNEEAIKITMEKFGLKEVMTKRRIATVDFGSLEDFVNYIADGHNAGADLMIRSFQATHDVDKQLIKDALTAVIGKDEKWKHVNMEIVLCVGRKV